MKHLNLYIACFFLTFGASTQALAQGQHKVDTTLPPEPNINSIAPAIPSAVKNSDEPSSTDTDNEDGVPDTDSINNEPTEEEEEQEEPSLPFAMPDTLDLSDEEKTALLASYKESIKEEDFTQTATLQALNKITARAYTLEAELNKKVSFGNINIELQRCWKAPQDQMPESKALLEIWEKIPSENARKIFHGWMFASSPSLSAMEHPVYDVRVLSCNKAAS